MSQTESPDEKLARARRESGASTRSRFAELGVTYPPARVLFRAFKSERELELWIGDKGKKMVLFRTYAIAGSSGTLGPKRKEGDKQVPEGVYFIDRYNPASKFYLSLGLNYPNAHDKSVADPSRPGGDIFIHGDTRSIGCLAMTDEKIREIYPLALDARDGGQSKVPVHIFPFRMSRQSLAAYGTDYPQWK